MPSLECKHIEVCVFRTHSPANSLPPQEWRARKKERGKRRTESVEYLLLKRSEKKGLYPGIWQIITGKIKKGESAIDAARRELAEETAIRPVRFWVVPHVTTFYNATDDSVNQIPFFCAEAGTGREPKLSKEHVEYEWVSFGETQQRIVWPGQRKGVRIVHDFIVSGGLAGKLSLVDSEQ